MEARNEGENLLLRRTQGDLLQKLRQLQQWRQEKEEHLLQDKEKQMSLLRDKERQLYAVQEYQRKILGKHPNNLVTSGIEGSPSFQVKPGGFHEGSLSRPLLNENVTMSGGMTAAVPPGINPPARNVLLSPQHFKATSSNMNSSYVSPPMKHQNQMLLTQGLQLPAASDDELSQSTESDAASIADIEGIRPIEDTPSEVSEASEDEDDFNSDSSNSNHGDDNNETLVDDDGGNHIADGGDHNDDIDDHYGDDPGGDFDHDDSDDDDIEAINKQVFGSGPGHDNSKPSFDDVPIKPGLGAQTKTFEELLDQQLQVEQQTKKQEETRGSETTLASKRTFLRKGEGIARFGVRPKVEAKQELTTTLKAKEFGNKFVEQKGPVTRKTATVKHLATEKPTVKQSASVRQTITGLAKRTATVKQTESIVRNDFQREAMIDHQKQPFPPKKVHFDTGQYLPHGSDPFTDDVFQEQSESCSEDGDLEEGGDIVTGNEVVIIEDSFQERMKNWDELEVVEKQELNEFEQLEEAAAANCSLSSNSSTVLKFLGKKRGQNRADLNNNLLGTRQQWSIAQKGSETVEPDHDLNRTLTEEKLDDDQIDEDDTLKDPEVISVRSSLALSDGFDDTKTWDDHDALDVSDVTDDVMLALNTSTPEGKTERRSSQAQKRKTVHSSTPPTSALVTKLFPQLKAKNEPRKSQNQPPPQPPVAEQVVRLDAGLSAGADGGLGMSSAVRDKLQELGKEIEKFREENVALHTLREERVKDLQELQKERELFENYKTEELERIEKFKTEEEKRLRRDRRVFEQYQKASRALPDKKERDEITILKAKISELQEDVKLRESRWSAAATRYKDRINNLEKENREMREEVKLLEKQNLDLQRKEQQKMRELLQYKAFEKKKLKKPEEIPLNRSPTSNVPQIKEHKNEDVFNEDEKTTTARVGIKKQPKPASDIRPSHSATKNVSPPDKIKTVEQVDPEETRRTDDSGGNENVDNTSSVPARSKDHSPPTKQAGSSKNVRFKDDGIQGQEKRPETLTKQLCHSDGKREIINPDGSRVVTFTNGTRKEISADGLSVVVTFFNGDVKQILPDDRVEYYYAEVQTTHTTYPDGLEVLRFPSNQIEKHYPDGTKEIIFPDQTVKYLYTSGAEECVFTEGTVERISVDGERIVEFPNGQRETYTKLFKKREYPDGTVKTVYSDGRQETRYASGRLRIKDGEGRLLVDTAEHNTQAQLSVAS